MTDDSRGFAAGLVFVAVYAVLRLVGPPEILNQAWIAAAMTLAFISPVGGLTILAAVGPFTEALTADGRITAVPFLLAAVGLSVAVRVAVNRPLPRPSWPIVLALLIMAGTALGVLNSWLTFGPERGRAAAELWVPGIGGAMTVLLAAAWLGWRGETRPLFVAAVSTTVAALVSAFDLVVNGLARSTDPARLGGIIPAPNAAAAIFLVAFAVCLAVVVLDERRWPRLVAAGGAAVALIALGLTFSRSGVLAVGIALAAIAWARWQRRGLVVGVGALLAAVVLVVVAGAARAIPPIVDQERLAAWQAAIGMWQACPLFGAGFRAFEWLHADFGSATLNAPHNEWLRFLAEEGSAVGAGGILFALLTPVLLLRQRGVIAAAAGAAAAGLFVMACFNNPFLYAQVNVPAFIVIGTAMGATIRPWQAIPRVAPSTS